MIHTTLENIRAKRPCAEGWSKLLAYLGKTAADDKPLALVTILKSNGLPDAIWSLRATPGADREARLFALSCARDVQHLMRDPRSLAALDVVERFTKGEATASELGEARATAAYAAEAAAYTGNAAAYAAYAAAYAAEATAAAAARKKQAAAAYAAAREKQAAHFRRIFGGSR